MTKANVAFDDHPNEKRFTDRIEGNPEALLFPIGALLFSRVTFAGLALTMMPWLLSGGTSSNASMLATRKAVDKGIPVARAALGAEQSQLSAASRSAQSALFNQIARLGKIRAAIDAGTTTGAPNSRAASAYCAAS